ncbi:MAG: hypothetical protein Q4P05_05330 [Actinomycetaceae bacterium]|nr:hypothetical protein [Actinomycetaceae bacterium]
MDVDIIRQVGLDRPVHDETGGEDSRCMFSDTLCVMPATHALVLPEADMGVAEYRYCVRHYVLILAEFLDIHVPVCSNPIVEHYLAFGEINDLEVLSGALESDDSD